MSNIETEVTLTNNGYYYTNERFGIKINPLVKSDIKFGRLKWTIKKKCDGEHVVPEDQCIFMKIFDSILEKHKFYYSEKIKYNSKTHIYSRILKVDDRPTNLLNSELFFLKLGIDDLTQRDLRTDPWHTHHQYYLNVTVPKMDDEIVIDVNFSPLTERSCEYYNAEIPKKDSKKSDKKSDKKSSRSTKNKKIKKIKK